MISNYKSWLSKKQLELNQAKTILSQNKKELQKEQEKLQNNTEAVAIVKSAAEIIQKTIHNHISTIVTRCLSVVFDENAYEFQILFEQKKNRTEARLVFTKEGREIDPMFSCGGGVIDVAAFALRLACLVLSRPAKRRLLVLDEPFRMLSVNYQRRIESLIEELAKELDVQIIMITHSEHLQIGQVIEVE